MFGKKIKKINEFLRLEVQIRTKNSEKNSSVFFFSPGARALFVADLGPDNLVGVIGVIFCAESESET